MPKQLLFSDAARRKMLEGVDILAHAVGTTLGPTGRNVILSKSFGGPTVTKDGVTVSKEIELSDPFENMGAKLVNVVASKTSDTAGDGTTTATILARAIFREGLRIVTSGANPTAVRRGIEKAVEAAVEELTTNLSRPVSKKEEIAQVGTISANNDPVIGNLLADAVEKVGRDGVITVEEGKTATTTLEFVEGMQFDKGYISPLLRDRARSAMEVVLSTNALHSALREEDQRDLRDLVPVMEKVARKRAGHPVHHRRGRGRRSPGDPGCQQDSGQRQQRARSRLPASATAARPCSEDIAVLTGGDRSSREDLGLKLENLTARVSLGTAKQRDQVTKDEHHDCGRRGRPRRRSSGTH